MFKPNYEPSLIEQIISPEIVPLEEQLTIIDSLDENITRLYELEELLAIKDKE